MMLRDRYYLGYVTYQDGEIQGRHEALIDDDLFGRVQDIIEPRAAAKNAAASTTTTSKAPYSAAAARRPGSPSG